jgi:Helix-turn-helix domain
MEVTRLRRPSDSKLVEVVARVLYGGDGPDGAREPDVTLPDGLWDIAVIRHRGGIVVLQTGLITKPVLLPFDPGDEYLAISFRPGVVMPVLPGARTVDQGIVRESRPRAFRVEADTFEIPTYDNAEALVDRLVRRGFLVFDDVVARVADGEPGWASERTIQRRFQWALGLTPKELGQIRRARRAVDLLRAGWAAADVAAELDYADQPHLIRSLRRFMGDTPGRLAAP